MSDMKLTLKRRWIGPRAIIGELFVDDEIKRQCVTLEDLDRSGSDKILQKNEKIDGETCIPSGTYQVVLDHSTRFGRILPRLLNVPNFSGIRIHNGNTDKDTHGCVLVGRIPINASAIGESKLALEELMALLDSANKHGKIFITIEYGAREGEYVQPTV